MEKIFTWGRLFRRSGLNCSTLCILGIILICVGWLFQIENLAEAKLTLSVSKTPEDIIAKPDMANMNHAGQPENDRLPLSENVNSGEAATMTATTPYHGDKIVYLTFDDGPDPVNTPQVLKILREHKIKATFFIIGMEAEKHPILVKDIFREGHAIGNHSYNHNYSELYRSADAYMSQLHRTDEIIIQATGLRPNISRAPGGAAGNFTNTYWKLLKQQGCVDIGWNVSSVDTAQISAKQIADNVAEQIAAKKYLWNHAIVLMHDGSGHAETVKALPNVIRYLKTSGFQFRVVNHETPSAW